MVATLDAGALAQILDNLLGNGVRYSPTGGILTVSAAQESGNVSIRVQERGPGIDPARHDLLFKKFPSVRGDAIRWTAEHGHGVFHRRDAVRAHGRDGAL